MRAETNTWDQSKIRGEVGPIENEESAAVRRSELEHKDASNLKQDSLSTRADRDRKNGENKSNGANQTGAMLSRNASRIAVKKELQPILQGAGVDAPLSDPKQLSDSSQERPRSWKTRDYAKSAEGLGDNYKRNSDKAHTSKIIDRHSRSKKLE